MRRHSIALMLAAALCLPSAALAQRKQKDPVLQSYLEEQFAALNKKLDDLGEKLAAVEADLSKLKQQQADTAAELRTAENIARNTDSSLSSFRLSNQQDIISLKTDVARIRQDLTLLAEGAKKAEAASAAPPPEKPKVEGYITDPPAEGKEAVTINLGSAAGVRAGMRLGVFKAAEPKTQVGLLEVSEVLDANNSRCKVVYSKPGIKLEFSDIVRLE
jgi:hypothetical protein